MRIALRAIMALSIAAFAVSCAETADKDVHAIEQAALDEWIKAHAPEAQPLTDGIYYEVLTPAPDGAEAVTGGNWLLADYEIKDINGNTAYTRSEATARKLGSYSKYTHYVPDMMFLGTKPTSSTMPEAMFHALQRMKTGEVWRIYATSRHVFNSRGINNLVGYGGQYPLAIDSPVIIDNLEVLEIIENPDLRERSLITELVTSPAPEGWGMSEADSLKSYFYMQRLNPDNTGKEVPVGSTVWLYYKAMFLDGTLLDTNIDSVWTNRFGGIRYYVNQQGISVPVEDTAAVGINRKSPAEIFTEMPKKVFGLLLEKNNLRYNDSMRMVVASPYAYGDAGRVGYVGYSSTYTFNTAYYGTGGYAGADGNKGASTYDSSMASFYHFYNTAATSSNIHPIAEVKYFTPIIYEFVVKEPKIQ